MLSCIFCLDFSNCKKLFRVKQKGNKRELDEISINEKVPCVINNEGNILNALLIARVGAKKS